MQAIFLFEIPTCRFCQISVPSTTLVEMFSSMWICNSLPNFHPAASAQILGILEDTARKKFQKNSRIQNLQPLLWNEEKEKKVFFKKIKSPIQTRYAGMLQKLGQIQFAFSIRTACVHSSQSPSVALKGGGGGMQWPHNPIWNPVCLHCNHICWMVANLPQKRKVIAKNNHFNQVS